ncbi:MAG: cellulase family glycosylhydrolase [Ignavibacteria bacterium]|jgi:hypothetical protein
MKYFRISFLILALLASCAPEPTFKSFITKQGNKLYEGEKEFRFLSFNIPNLNFVEDEMEFTKIHPFALPTSFEIRDALESVKQMGGTVVRLYTFPVKRESDTLDIPRYVVGPGEFDENSFVVMDTVLAIANEVGVRLILPLVNNWQWMGGAPQYAAFRNKEFQDFWTDSLLIDDFKKTVEFVLNRTNTVTSIKYKDDKSILCWETGNELQSPYEWTYEIASFIKALDTNHLLMDGYYAIDGNLIMEESIEDSVIDILSSHHYAAHPDSIIKHIRENIDSIGNRKPYVIGEFGFLSTPALERVIDFIIDNEITGGLIWSLRYHREKGGYYWHSEPLGNAIYKAFHWPGYKTGIEYNEEQLMRMYREKAFEIRELKVPELNVPEPPVLLPVKKVSKISWKGSAGAKYYDVERSGSKSGPWEIVGYNISDAAQYYTPLFYDNTVDTGKEYYYRLISKNLSGSSEPSNVVGPVKVLYKTYIDEMQNFTRLFYGEGKLELANTEDRKFKEIDSRIKASEGSSLYYYVPGYVKNVKINTFAKSDSSSLGLYLSADNTEFDTAVACRESFFIGKGDYDYWIPSQYKYEVTDTTKLYSYFKIIVNEVNQLARVEIDYVPKAEPFIAESN